MNKPLMVAAVAGLGYLAWNALKKGGTLKTSAANGASATGGASAPTSISAGMAASGVVQRQRPVEAVDYRVAYKAATSTKDKSIIRENELRTARNTGTAVASDEYANGIPLPWVTGAMAPSGNQPAYMSLKNYIKNGFKFEGGGINDAAYAKANFMRVFEDWKTRFGMPLTW